MRVKEELINSWIRKAARNLLAAEHELSFPDADKLTDYAIAVR